MENFKDFTGKDLDDAIAEACAYFNTEREQLEVDIVQDSKSGIFGLVGARKAMIKARRMQLNMPMEDAAPKEAPKKQEKAPKPAPEANKTDVKKTEAKKPAPEAQAKPEPKKESSVPPATKANAEPKMEEHEEADDNEHRIHFNQLDKEQLKEISHDVISKLILPIVGMVPINIEFEESRVCIGLDCGEDSGLLIGREGQTLAALQYISSRIISRKMQSSVRVQLDAGDYRTRQDDKLRDLVLFLAERVRTTGKSHSTRPLSSYHRRIVHVALQESTDLVTRSSGEGPLKRVVIQRKRGQQSDK